jgi:hypothetical protein
MATLRDFEKNAIIQLDKYSGTFLVVDRSKLKKLDDGKTEINARHVMDLSKQYKQFSELAHEYIVELESLAVELIRENYRLRGLTPTEQEIIDRLNKAGLKKYQKLVAL